MIYTNPKPLKTKIEVLKQDPKYGVSIKVKQVQLSYPYLTKVNPTSKKFTASFIMPKKNLNAQIKKQLQAIAKYLGENSELLKEKKIGKPGREKIIKTWLDMKNKDGAFFKDGDKIKDDETGEIRPESSEAYVFSSKSSTKNENGIEVPKVKIDLRDKYMNEIKAAEAQALFYGGAIVNVELTVNTYFFGGKVGITTYLNGVQHIGNSKAFTANRSSFEADDSFDDEPAEEGEENVVGMNIEMQ